jgi:hypothetical protein
MRRQIETQADFTYSMSGNVISIVDLDQGNRSVTNDVEHVLRKIEHYHQAMGFWDGGSNGTVNMLCSFHCERQTRK